MRFSVLPHKDNTFSPNSPTPHPKTHNTNNLQKPQKPTLFSLIYPHNQQHHNVRTCLRHVSLQSAMLQRITQHAKGMSLRYGVIVLGNLIRFFTKKSFYHQGEWIEVRFMVLISGFQHLVGDHLFGGKINWERRKMQIHAPLNIVKMY